jgi:hypothetical protein
MEGSMAEEGIQVPVAWVGAEEAPTHTVNQFVCQFSGPEEFILTLGHLEPPTLLGSPEERLEQARQLSYVPVRVVSRVGLTRSRVEELITVLQEILANFDKSTQEGSAG